VTEGSGGGVASSGQTSAEVAVHREAGAGGAVKGVRPAYFPERRQFEETTVYDRARLAPGDAIHGPAVVEEEGSTLVIGPGGAGRVAPSGNIVVMLP